MERTSEKILEKWIEHVNRSEVDAVINLYDRESTLLPTFSPHPLSTPELIRDYFTQLASREKLNVVLHDKTLSEHQAGNSIAILTGVYSFSFQVDDAYLTFPSRFTFIIDSSKDRPILHHHSSQVPRTLS